MEATRTCLHFVSNHCTASICLWKVPKDPLACKVNGQLKSDSLTPRNPREYTAIYDPERRPL